MYTDTPQLAGFWDTIKAAASRLKKVQPGKIILREAGFPTRDPQLNVTPGPAASPLAGIDKNTLLIGGAILLFLMMKKGRR